METLQAKDYRGLRIERARLEEEELLDAALEQVSENIDLRFSPEDIDTRAMLLLRNWLAQTRYNNFSNGRYTEIVFDMQRNPEDYQDRFRRDALRELREERILQAVIDAEALEVSQQELESEASAMAARQHASLSELRQILGEDLSLLRRDLLLKKAREIICDSAVLI